MADARTIFCANLSSRITEELLYELFLQAGPLVAVRIPKDAKGEQRSFAFIEYKHECSVDYAIQLFQETYMFGKELQLNHRKSKNQNSPDDANPHLKRQSSLPNMHQRATGMLPRLSQLHMGLPNINIPFHPMMMTQGPFIPPINSVMGPPFLGLHLIAQDARRAAFMDQPPRVQRHQSDRRSRTDFNQVEDRRERDEARRERSERHHRRSHSDHHRRRSRSRSRSRSPERSHRHGDRDHDRRSRNDDEGSDYRRYESRNRYWER